VNVYDWGSGSSVLLASSSYGYDQTAVTATSGTPQQVSITGSRGNLTTSTDQTSSGGATLSSTYTYYDTGNPNTSTDVNGAVTTYVYGASTSCGNSFPTTINEPLSLSRSMSWNCTGGVATSATDENSQIVSASYSTDPDFWRPESITDQTRINPTSITYSGQTAAESTLSLNGGNSVVDTRATFDGFGRTILSQRLQGPGATNYDTSETDYNIVGLPSRSTMPFSASAGGTSSTAPGVSTWYDALGRPTSSTNANGGATSYTYTNNDVLISVSGSQTFKKQLEYDGLGRLTSVCEISTTLSGVGTCGQSNSQTGYWTKYTYDAAGRLLTVTQNAQASSGHQTRSYSYDKAGRLTSETNPETGSVSYTYDTACGSYSASNGDLTKRVDNAGNATCYAYDALHRVTDAGYNGPICMHYRYDNSPTPYNGGTPPSGVTVSNTLTRLKEASTDQCSFTTLQTDEWFSYSVRGELTDVYESTPHSGTYDHTTASYWASGALETLSGIPSVPTINYGAGGSGLDGEGRYTQVTASRTLWGR
jgi:YD repeat-containing protein